MNHLPLEKAIILDEELKKAGVEMETEQVWELLEEITGPVRYNYEKSDKRSIQVHKVVTVDPSTQVEVNQIWGRKPYKWTTSETICPCPTASEMEALFLDITVIGESEYELQTFRSNGISVVVYIDRDKEESIVYKSGESLLEAVYEALLWCLREGYVKGKE